MASAITARYEAGTKRWHGKGQYAISSHYLENEHSQLTSIIPARCLILSAYTSIESKMKINMCTTLIRTAS
jgi:hypothetical protein